MHILTRIVSFYINLSIFRLFIITGFLVWADNPEEIAEYIKELSDKSKRAMFGKRIREIVGKKFNWDNIIEKYINVYDSIS